VESIPYDLTAADTFHVARNLMYALESKETSRDKELENTVELGRRVAQQVKENLS